MLPDVPRPKRRRRLLAKIALGVFVTPLLAVGAFLVFQPAAPPERDYGAEWDDLAEQRTPESSESIEARDKWQAALSLIPTVHYDARDAAVAQPEWRRSDEHADAIANAEVGLDYLRRALAEESTPEDDILHVRASEALSLAYAQAYIDSGISQRIEAIGCDAPILHFDYSGPLIAWLKVHLSPARHIAEAERMRQYYEPTRDPSLTVSNILTCANACTANPMLIDGLVMVSLRTIAADLVVELLRGGALTQDDCAALMRVIDQCWPVGGRDTVYFLESERLLALDTLHAMHTGELTIGGPQGSVLWRLFMRGKHRADHDAMGAMFDNMIALAADAPHTRASRPTPIIDADATPSIVEAITGTISRWLWIADADATRRDALRIMLALELHRHATGAYPQALDGLVPDYLSRVPPDRFAPDARFRYALTPDNTDATGFAYTLYSVGADAIDDGARTDPKEPKRGLLPPPGWEPTTPYPLSPPPGQGIDRVFTTGSE